MPPEMRVPGTGDNVGESRWTDTYVVHSRNRLIHRIRYGVYERAFFGHVAGKDARILDVGCGSGEFISLLRQRGYTNLQGVEIDDALIDLAAELPVVIRKSSATALPYADGSFDCIYMFNVMHHLHGMAEYERALAEMGRCLRDGGRIILVEPCRLVLYRLLKWVCFIGRPFGPFFRNFYVILQEEWPELSSFLRHLDPLRARIAATKGFVVQEDRKLLHQWITVITVDKGAPRATTEQAGRCDSQN